MKRTERERISREIGRLLQGVDHAEWNGLALERLNKPAQGRLLRTPQAAEYLGISPARLRDLAQRGEIPVVWNKYWLFDKQDLDSWVERNKGRLL